MINMNIVEKHNPSNSIAHITNVSTKVNVVSNAKLFPGFLTLPNRGEYQESQPK